MNSFAEHIHGDKPVLVDFYATWCGPCKMMAPILQSVKKVAGEGVTILKMDIDKNPQYAQRYGIQSVPTLILFRQGQMVWRKTGVVPAHEIQQQLQVHTGPL